MVKVWREKISEKYTKLSREWDLHDFTNVRHLLSGDAAMSVLDLCSKGIAHRTTEKSGFPLSVVTYK